MSINFRMALRRRSGWLQGRTALCWQLPLLLMLSQSVTASSQTPPGIGPLANMRFVRQTGDMLGYELLPNFNGSYKRATFRTNRWGMRDRDYDLMPAPRTFRIALVGSSFSMGGGVPVERTFEWLIEDMLNRERPGLHASYEILNFSVGGYSLLQEVAVMEKKVFLFAPNAVIIVIHGMERGRALRHLSSLVRAGVPTQLPYLDSKIQEAGVNSRMQEPEILRRLDRVYDDMVKLSYQHVAELCRKKTVRLVGIAFPGPFGTVWGDRQASQLSTASQLALQAGIPVLSLDGVYYGYSVDSLRLSDRDFHLNALGHRVVAERLYELLRSNDVRALKLGFSKRR